MKKWLRYIILLIIIAVAAFLIIRTSATVRQKDIAAATIQTLPPLKVYSMNGDKVNIQDIAQDKAAIVIYFSPDCEHCQYEAASLHNHLPAFIETEAVLFMITRSDTAEAMPFARNYHLNNISFIHFLWDKDNSFFKTFGTQVFPSIFIYNKEHKLVKKFIGETKTEAILNSVGNGK